MARRSFYKQDGHQDKVRRRVRSAEGQRALKTRPAHLQFTMKEAESEFISFAVSQPQVRDLRHQRK